MNFKTFTIFSDYICPFCYLAKTQLDRVVREVGLKVEWREMEIHPETPPQGLPDKYLDDPRYRNAWAAVERIGDEYGVEIRQPRVGANSHLAILTGEFAKERGRFDEVHDRIFRAYWLEGKNVGDLTVLTEIVERVGFEARDLRAYLESGRGEERLTLNQQEAERFGVHAVPSFFWLNRRLTGTTPYSNLLKFISEPIRLEKGAEL